MHDRKPNVLAPDSGAPAGEERELAPPLTNAELVQLQVRMIALENLVIALLTDASEAQLDRCRDMAAHIFPREGHTRHRLTMVASAEMISLVQRANRFRDMPAL